MNRLLQILFWSVISAAFIGPGTVTTAASAGVSYRYTILWALLFSTIACYTLQEASARLTIVSGRNLGQALRLQFHTKTSGLAVMVIILGAIILGNAAYEAGNILGGVAGAMLASPLPQPLVTLLIGLLAGFLLFFGSTQTVAKILGGVVALMGIAFLITAIQLKPDFWQIINGLVIPHSPGGSGLLILGLIGTTVVPYNLFLGSGIARGQRVEEFRFGLFVAIFLGGLISMAVLVVGAAGHPPFSFKDLAETLADQLGGWALFLFAFGLFAAGFSSAITAPLAAAITAQSLFGEKNNQKWDESGWRFRAVWLGVLLSGILFGLTNVKPVPVIILAQALNGILLPFVAIFLFLTVNDSNVMGHQGLNSFLANGMMALVVAVSNLLGLANIFKAFARVLGFSQPSEGVLFYSALTITALLAVPMALVIRNKRKGFAKP